MKQIFGPNNFKKFRHHQKTIKWTKSTIHNQIHPIPTPLIAQLQPKQPIRKAQKPQRHPPDAPGDVGGAAPGSSGPKWVSGAPGRGRRPSRLRAPEDEPPAPPSARVCIVSWSLLGGCCDDLLSPIVCCPLLLVEDWNWWFYVRFRKWYKSICLYC